MKWTRPIVVVAVAAGIAGVACGSFHAAPDPDAAAAADADGGPSAEAGPAGETGPSGESGSSACPVESCGDAGPSCRFVDFSAGCPTSNFSFTGDEVGVAGVEGNCQSGKVHVAAAHGMGVAAVLETTTPGALDAIHLSARIAVTAWDPGPVLSVALAGVVVAEVRALGRPSGNPAFVLCGAGAECGTEIFESAVGVEHTFTLDITRSSLLLGVDCQPFAKGSGAIKIEPSQPLAVSFGKTGAVGIDGTLDDLLVTYR